MDEMKWAWVLFVAASLAVLIRLAMWFVPSPVVQHSEKVSEALEAVSPAVPEAPAAEEPEAQEWPVEAEERPDGRPAPEATAS